MLPLLEDMHLKGDARVRQGPRHLERMLHRDQFIRSRRPEKGGRGVFRHMPGRAHLVQKRRAGFLCSEEGPVRSPEEHLVHGISPGF